MGSGILKGIQAHSMAGTHISGLGCVFLGLLQGSVSGCIFLLFVNSLWHFSYYANKFAVAFGAVGYFLFYIGATGLVGIFLFHFHVYF